MAFICSSVALQPLSLNEKRVIAEMTAFEHSSVRFFRCVRKIAKSDY